MDGYHIAFVVLLIMSIELNRRFYNNYIADPPFDVAFYPSTKYKTGDLIFFRALDSKHLVLTDTYFSHVGIVIMIGSVPYILELTPPNVKFSLLSERFSQYFSGLVFVKPLKYRLNSRQLSLVPGILQWASRISYPEKHMTSVMNYLDNCNTDVFWGAKGIHDFECAKFVIYILRDLGLIYGNEIIGCNGVTYLAELDRVRGNTYEGVNVLATINNSNLSKFNQMSYRKL